MSAFLAGPARKAALLLALASPWATACSGVVLEGSTSGATSTTDTTTGTAGSGGSGGGTSTAGGGSGGASTGTAGSAGAGGGSGAELVAQIVYPSLLRLDDTGVFVVSTDAQPKILRFDKATLQESIVTDAIPYLLDYVVDQDTVFASEAAPFCFECSPPPGSVRSVPITGGAPLVLASKDPWIPSRITLGQDSIFVTDSLDQQLQSFPIAGGVPAPATAMAVDWRNLAEEWPWVYFSAWQEPTIHRYDETNGDVLTVAPPIDPPRSLLGRNGDTYWLTGDEPTSVRTAHNDQLWTIMTSDARGWDLAVDDDHAFLVTIAPADSPEFPNGDLWMAPLFPGEEPQILVASVPQPTEVEVDQTHVYFLTQGIDGGSGALWRVPLP